MKTWNTPSVTVCTAAELQETIQAKAWSSTEPIEHFLFRCNVGDYAYVHDQGLYGGYFFVTCTWKSSGFLETYKELQRTNGLVSVWRRKGFSTTYEIYSDWHY